MRPASSNRAGLCRFGGTRCMHERKTVDTSKDHFDANDLELLNSLRGADGDEGELPNADGASIQQAAHVNASSEQGTDSQQANGTGQAVEETVNQGDNQNASAQNQSGGDLRQALRAARRSERQAREAARRAEEELEQLRQKVGAGAEETDPDADLQDFPQVAQALKRRDQEIATLREQLGSGAANNGTAQQPEFQPPQLPTEVQEVVDDVPGLLALQHNPDQTGWQMAVAIDQQLRLHPAWKDKPDAERFAEVARRATQELSQSQVTPPAPSRQEADPAKVIDAALKNAPRRQPETISDFGGTATEPEANNLARYQKMSDEDIVNDLLRGG